MERKIVILLPGMLGAGCTSIAYELSRRLGLEVINSERIIREIVSEKRVSFQELASMISDGEINLEDVIRNVVLDYVREGGVVIEGRTAFMVLDRQVTLKAFLYADVKVRAERVAKQLKINLEDAMREVERSDEDRNRLVEWFYKKQFTDLSLYDVMIDTSRASYSEVANFIESIVKMKVS